MENLTERTKFDYSKLQKISVEIKGKLSRKLSHFELFLSQATRNKCFGAEIKVKIVNHIKPSWKCKEGDSCINLFFAS